MPDIPNQLLNSLSQLNGFDEKAFVDAHQEENKITSIRLNPFKKPNTAEFDFELSEKVNWAEDAYYLGVRPLFTFDPLFHAGCYYVQEAGSMFVEFALKNTVDFSAALNVLDLCAAPGGKSTLINSLLNQESLLVANEIIKSRSDILAQNLGKWGTNNTIVTNNEPHKFSLLQGFFDVLLVDAPCSGSGLFRKQPEAINEWSEDSVKLCSTRQVKILESSLSCLKENGILVYSTCSYSVEENEAVVSWLINECHMETVSLPVPSEWGIEDTGSGYRFYPHLTKSEGFFCAVLKKNKPENDFHVPKNRTNQDIGKSERLILEPFIADTGSKIVKKNNHFHLLNKAAFDFLCAFDKQFYFKKAGCVIGEIKGNDMVPNHEFALSINLRKNGLQVDLNKENALKFLKKENFMIEPVQKGLALITYKHFGIGWAKILPNRINNYLPQELRNLIPEGLNDRSSKILTFV